MDTPSKRKPRGKIEPAAQLIKQRRPVIVAGRQPCPDGHGSMYDWRAGVWFCSHNDHGGNGKFFTDEALQRDQA